MLNYFTLVSHAVHIFYIPIAYILYSYCILSTSYLSLISHAVQLFYTQTTCRSCISYLYSRICIYYSYCMLFMSYLILILHTVHILLNIHIAHIHILFFSGINHLFYTYCSAVHHSHLYSSSVCCKPTHKEYTGHCHI